MNVSSATSTPTNATASSTTSSPFAEYMNNGNSSSATSSSTNRSGAASVSCNGGVLNSTNPSTSNSGLTASGSAGLNTHLNGMTLGPLDPTDHLQQLKQMTQGALTKSDAADANGGAQSGVSTSTAAGLPQDFYQFQYSWPYYGQFSQPMTAQTAAAFSAWPQPYNAAPWNYAQTKKGRQTYQRYQTSILEQKFQQNSYVSKKQREELRAQTGLTDRQIKIWFQNRRMKAKKEKHRSEEQTDHQSIALPCSTNSKPMPNPLNPGMGNGVHGAAQQPGMVLNGMDLGILDDDKKMNGLAGATTTMAWPMQSMNMMGMQSLPNAADPMVGWSLPPTTHVMQPQAQPHQMQNYYGIPYPICQPWADKSPTSS